MRTEREMMDLILRVAQDDPRIRAVYMNGSRTNPNVPKDIFQDYDIVYVVTETGSFRQKLDWIDIFGKRLCLQLPEEMNRMLGHEEDCDNCYGYLMLFADGNRIDLHLQTVPYAQKAILRDKLCRVLLDKDGVLPPVPASTDEDYWVQRPTQELFTCCCNEFWWLQNNVAKGLWREEIPYAMDMLNFWIRPQLTKMLSWQVGVQTGFSCSVGKSGKYLPRYLSQNIWEQYRNTYPAGQIPAIWDAVFCMCNLFDEAARKVAAQCGLHYNEEEARGSRFFLNTVHRLPKDAAEIL